MFLIFVNDLPSSIVSSHIYLFADDTKCLKPIHSISDCYSLQRDLLLLFNWSQNWNLPFNGNKCALLRFTANNPFIPFLYNLNDTTQVTSSTHHKDLGVFISQDLSWNEHLKYISSRAYKLLGLMQRSFSNSHYPFSKKILYTVLIRPQLLYCSQIWRPHLLKDIILIEKIQHRATKYILNDYSSNYKSRLTDLRLLPLMMQFELNDSMFFIKCLKQPESEAFPITSYVTFCSSCTRSSSTL